HPGIEIQRGEIAGLPPADWGNVIVATGPLTSASLAGAICELTDENALAFFDAIAPIVHKDSIDMSVAWFQSRYDKLGPGGTGADYINCPLTHEQYDAFVDALIAGEKTNFKEWETNTPYFDGCLPIEVMAERGRETLRHGPMKPVGLTNAHDPLAKPYAIVQLRQDNKLGTLYNMVGFQTKLKYGPQQSIFRPMNINFGLFPPLVHPPTKKPDGSRLRGNEKTIAKKQAISARALSDLDRWIADNLRIAAAA